MICLNLCFALYFIELSRGRPFSSVLFIQRIHYAKFELNIQRKFDFPVPNKPDSSFIVSMKADTTFFAATFANGCQDHY